MTAELEDLYQEMILEHSRRPRNFRKLDGATRSAEGFNPLCGDHLMVYLDLGGGVIREVTFEGTGCAISSASASLMTGAVAGKTVADAEALFGRFQRLVTEGPESVGGKAALGKLAVFSGVRAFPVRVKCASLPWHTLRAALAGAAGTVTTE